MLHRRDGEDVKREVICNKEEEKRRQEQARNGSAVLSQSVCHVCVTSTQAIWRNGNIKKTVSMLQYCVLLWRAQRYNQSVNQSEKD